MNLRLREYGSADWTEVEIEGELEEFAADLLLACLEGNSTLHVQREGEDGWEDV